MHEWWIAVVFGWAVIVSVILAGAGIVYRNPVLLLVSALLVGPFSLYLSGGNNWLAVAGGAIPLTLVAGAYAVKRRRPWVAWCLLAPFVGVAIWLAVGLETGTPPEWWPAGGRLPVIVSMMLAGAGIVYRNPVLLLVSALLMAPFSLFSFLFVSGANDWLIAVAGGAIPLTLVAGAYAVKRRRPWVAWCLLAPFVAIWLWLAVRGLAWSCTTR